MLLMQYNLLIHRTYRSCTASHGLIVTYVTIAKCDIIHAALQYQTTINTHTLSPHRVCFIWQYFDNRISVMITLPEMFGNNGTCALKHTIVLCMRYTARCKFLMMRHGVELVIE